MNNISTESCISPQPGRDSLPSRSRAAHSHRLIEIEDRIFTERRLWLYASGVLVAYVLGLVVRLFRRSWIFHADGRPSCIDFSHMWVSGNIAGSTNPSLVYDYSAFSAARAGLAGADACMPGINHFVYPPTYLFFTYPLGFMSYVPAFVAWMAVTLLLYLVAVYLIVPRPIAILAALSPFPVLFNAVLGQNGFLLAGLIGLSLALMERRPWLAGLFVGMLTFKPQIGILFPFALLSSRKWRALASATVTGAVLVIASMVSFGYQAWLSFMHTLVDRGTSLGPVPQEPMWLESVYGFLWSAGVSAPIAWAAQLTTTTALAMAVCWIWARTLSHALKAAAFCSAAAMATPFVHGHDLCIPSIAVAFLVRDGIANGFLPGDRFVMLCCWIGIFLIGAQTSSGWIPCLAIFALAARRALLANSNACRAPDLLIVPTTS